MPPPLSPSIGTSPLDAPPPSPTPMGEGPGSPFSAAGLVPQVASDQMPPEVLTGIVQAFASKVVPVLDAVAQALPDKAAQVGLIKELLQRLSADIMVSGAGPVSPTAPGPAFPGGGIDRGIAGPGTV